MRKPIKVIDLFKHWNKHKSIQQPKQCVGAPTASGIPQNFLIMSMILQLVDIYEPMGSVRELL